MKNTTDISLVKKAKKGDPSAFTELYRLVYEEMYYFALSNLGNTDDAADCVQDTALDAFTGIRNLKDDNAFHGWIMRILIIKIKQKQKEFILARENHKELDNDIPDFNNSFSGIEIMDALSQLNENERQCLSLRYISGYKGEEITKLTGIEHNTVRSHISRARKKLRKFLSEEEEDE